MGGGQLDRSNPAVAGNVMPQLVTSFLNPGMQALVASLFPNQGGPSVGANVVPGTAGGLTPAASPMLSSIPPEQAAMGQAPTAGVPSPAASAIAPPPVNPAGAAATFAPAIAAFMAMMGLRGDGGAGGAAERAGDIGAKETGTGSEAQGGNPAEGGGESHVGA